MTRILFRTALLAACIPALSGCVAALVPVVASGAFLGKEQLKPKTAAPETIVSVDEAATTEPVASSTLTVAAEPLQVAPTSAAPTEITAANTEPAELPAFDTAFAAPEAVEIERPSASFIGPVDVEPSETELVSVTEVATPPAVATPPLPTPVERTEAAPAAELATIPPSVAVPASRPALPTGPTDFRAYDALYSYVDSQARRDPTVSPRQSAILAAPGSLSPTRTDCSIRPPAILLDLDHGDESVDASMAPRANPALGQILASLRLQDIEIFWISKQPAIAAGAVRKALVASGLDPQGRDALLLMRRASDRKQSRRRELSETHCLLAIGGDRRADFDELYLYLKDNTAAQPLEELIGAGWFLTPLPLTEGQ